MYMDIVRTCMDGHASKHVSINIPTPNQAAPQPNDGSRATRLDCDAAAPPSCHGKNPCPPQDAQARTQPPPALFPRPYPAHPSTMQTRHGHERFVSDRCRMYSCRCTVEPIEGGFLSPLEHRNAPVHIVDMPRGPVDARKTLRVACGVSTCTGYFFKFFF